MKWLIAFVLALCPVSQAAAASQSEVEAYRQLARMDKRVATIGYRLAAANAPFCKKTQRNPGWVLHSYRQYPDRDAAKAAFDFPTPVAIAAVVEGGPAAKAGLREGLGLEEMSDGDIWWGGELQRHVASVELIETIGARMDKLFSEAAPVTLSFSTPAQGDSKIVQLDPPPICASTFFVDTKDKVDAGADGDRVRVTTGLLGFTPDDNELAAVIAHELAHNLLGHRARLDAVRKGKTKATYETEVEADQLSVWLMANAGYNPKAALTFAERFGRKYGLGLFSDGTHPRWKKRVAIMLAEIDLIGKTPAAKGLIEPPLLAKNSPQ
jgi:beta-barrel assembly-enhancing protease